jgi:hypothetical protein
LSLNGQEYLVENFRHAMRTAAVILLHAPRSDNCDSCYFHGGADIIRSIED